jgi:DNA-binding transcriptional LysR family regulator
MLDIHALQVFLEAAKTENFTKAGQVLNLSQPAVSMQIRSLESYLQVELFERNGRNIQLTKSGQALAPMAEQIVQMAFGIEESIRASQGKVVGNLVIGCSSASARYILPHLVARFQRLYPDVRVSIPVISRTEMVDRVIGGEYDLGVSSMRAGDHEVSYTEFFTDHLALIAPTSHSWTRRGSVEAHELLDERFICREPDSACRAAVTEGLGQLGVDINQMHMVMEIGNPEALAMAVEHGIGVSFVSLLAAMPRLGLGRLAIVNVEGLDLRHPVELVQSTSRPASPVQIKFLEFVKHPQNRPLIDMLSKGRMI